MTATGAKDVYGDAMDTKSVQICHNSGVRLPLRTFNDTVPWQICHGTVFFWPFNRILTRFRGQECRAVVSLSGSDTVPVRCGWHEGSAAAAARGPASVPCDRAGPNRTTFSPMTWVKAITVDLP